MQNHEGNAMRKSTKTTITAVLTAALTVGVASAAFAGSNSTYIADWRAGNQSQPWTDTGGTTTTAVSLSTCYGHTTIGPYHRYYAEDNQLQLQKQNAWGGWATTGANGGNSTANCGSTHRWSNQSSGTYKFQLNGWHQGGTWTTGGHLFNADSVYQTW